jgi:hypothetical protein
MKVEKVEKKRKKKKEWFSAIKFYPWRNACRVRAARKKSPRGRSKEAKVCMQPNAA